MATPVVMIWLSRKLPSVCCLSILTPVVPPNTARVLLISQRLKSVFKVWAMFKYLD